MNCEDYQEQLGNDAPSPAALAHAASCERCAELEAAWSLLDADFAGVAQRIAPPPDFKNRVMARLPLPEPRLSASEIAEKRLQYQREHEAALKALNKQFLVPYLLMLLQLLVVGILGCVVGVMIWEGMKSAPELVLPVVSEAMFTRFMQAFGIAVGAAGTLYGLKPSWRPAFS